MSSVSQAQKPKNVITIDWKRVGLGARLDKDIAKDLGVPRRRVTKERAKRGIAAYSKRNQQSVKPAISTPATSPVAADPTATTSIVVNQPPTPVTRIIADSPILSAPPEPPKKEAPKKLKNYIAVVLDDSGSISCHGLAGTIKDSYNQLVDTIKKSAADTGQETVFNLFMFGREVTHDEIDRPIEKVRPLYSYSPSQGSTALLDAVGAAIGYLKGRPDAGDENVSHLVIVLTDGEENSSKTFKPDNIHSLDKRSSKLLGMINEIQYAGNWTLTFQLPRGFKDRFAKTYSIPGDNIREWDQTVRGVEETFHQTNSAIGTYYTARASGQKSVQSFYTDLSKLKVSDVKKKLDDISDRFKEYTVDKEEEIKDFVERKTKRAYLPGQAFYLLMKPELIQASKGVLIKEKGGKKAVWGGDQARELIGLKPGEDAKVKPGNHSNYDVFIESRSVNRKLPRGTTVLVDVTQTVAKQETWDSSKRQPK